MKGNKKVKSIDDKIKHIERKTNELDYTKGLNSGIKCYKTLKKEIEDVTKELFTIENNFKTLDVDILSDDLDISDDEFIKNMGELSNLMIKIKECTDINSKIDMYYDIRRLIKICTMYQENMKIKITKLD
jgi:hypothetical protein